MEKYLVGGAVRDMLLGQPVKDRDYVVLNSSHEEMIAMGFAHCGKDFSVYLDSNGEEHALARTERKVEKGYHGFEASYDGVTLEQDLLRRDLTINSIAFDEDSQKIIDPLNGRKDLEGKILRHTSSAFSEDPLRVLRVARFAARYFPLGFSIAPETIELMREISSSGELEHITPQRVWLEVEKSLGEKHPEVFFRVLHQVGALKALMPDLHKMFSVEQNPIHHPEGDAGTHSLLCLSEMKKLSDSKELALAALLHDIGKSVTPREKWPKHHDHEKKGIPLFKSMASKYHFPNKYKEIGLIGIEFHTHIHRAMELNPKTLLNLFIKIDAFRKPERVKQLCLIGKSDSMGTGLTHLQYPQMEYIIGAYEAASSINTQEALKAEMHPQKAIEAARLKAIMQYKSKTLPECSPLVHL